MLPAELALEEEGDMSHYTIARKNDVTNTLPEIRHGQRFQRLASLSVRPRDRSRFMIWGKEGLVPARGSPIFSPKNSSI